MSSAMLLTSASSCGIASSRSSCCAAIPLFSHRLHFLPRPSIPRRGPAVLVSAVQKSPKGFGKPVQKPKKVPDGSSLLKQEPPRVEDDDEEEDEPEDDVVPEVVTNRMLKRITYTVGIPFAVGIAFFGLFYYLKAVKKVDIPEWLPLFTSFLTFGSSGAGITYGVLSASWDPKREGSLLGWKEAQLNWPVFWETFRGKRDSGKSR